MKTANNKVRIGAGIWRSRLLRFHEAQGLRPTPDRVRETLFNWLGQELHGLSCLDLFAGTGALGFEAASRGAASVVMVEQNPAVYRDLRENARQLEASQVQIFNEDALRFLSSNQQAFDVVFLDPPFNKDWLEGLLKAIPSHLAPQARVYVEAERALTGTEGLTVLKHGKAGQVFYHLLECRHAT